MAKKAEKVVMKLNISKLVAAELAKNPELKTQEVADLLQARMPDSKELAEAIAKKGFQSTVSIQRGKIKASSSNSKRTALPQGKPSSVDLIRFLDQAAEKKIDLAKLAETLALVAELGGQDKVLAMATTIAELRKNLKTDESIKAVLTTLHGSPF